MLCKTDLTAKAEGRKVTRGLSETLRLCVFAVNDLTKLNNQSLKLKLIAHSRQLRALY
jgi:hypothetical protein